MGHRTWVEHFGRDPKVLGRSFVLNGVPRPSSGSCHRASASSAPTSTGRSVLDRADPEQSRRYFMLQARLKPGVTLKQAEAEIGLVAQRLAKATHELSGGSPSRW